MRTRLLRIVYIDERDIDRRRYSSLLSRAGLVRTEAIAPRANRDLSEIVSERIDLYLVDYELTKRQRHGATVNYLGGSLAAAIREQQPEHPILALTRQDLFGSGDYEDARLEDVFDRVLYKSDVRKDPEGQTNIIVAVGLGFRALRTTNKRTWQELLHLLHAGPEEDDLLRQTGAPIKHTDGRASRWGVLDVTRWLSDVVFRYPGVLYDALYSACLLGISESAFKSNSVQETLSGAKYSGILGGTDERWWRRRLIRIASDFMRQQAIDQPLARGFSAAFAKAHRKKLQPSICVWSEEKHAELVCHVLRKPVKAEYSLPYHPDNRPAVMDTAVVSFAAIRDRNKVEDEKFGPASLQLLKQVRKLRK